MVGGEWVEFKILGQLLASIVCMLPCVFARAHVCACVCVIPLNQCCTDVWKFDLWKKKKINLLIKSALCAITQLDTVCSADADHSCKYQSGAFSRLQHWDPIWTFWSFLSRSASLYVITGQIKPRNDVQPETRLVIFSFPFLSLPPFLFLLSHPPSSFLTALHQLEGFSVLESRDGGTTRCSSTWGLLLMVTNDPLLWKREKVKSKVCKNPPLRVCMCAWLVLSRLFFVRGWVKLIYR